MLIAYSNFVRRQTAASEFSHWTGTEEQLVAMVTERFAQAKPGYRDGVCLVEVPPEGFFSSMVQLKPGDAIEGEYKARREGETPRKSTYCTSRDKIPAQFVEIVLYRADVLAEDNDRSSDADWEIISINANPVKGPMPIPVGALIANYFKLSGGTDSKMAPEQFVAQLRESVEFYADKAHCPPADRPTRAEILDALYNCVESIVPQCPAHQTVIDQGEAILVKCGVVPKLPSKS